MMETGVLVTLGIFIAGLILQAGRSLERMSAIGRELAELKADVRAELGEVKQVLYTTVGGRRAIRPIEVAHDAPAEHN